MSGVKIFDIKWCSHTAGPSPISDENGDNCRVELFFMGCAKAMKGDPCPGCFNPDLWQIRKNARVLDPLEMVQHLQKVTDLRYITIVGGEPLDQSDGLIELCEALKGWHKIVFTHYKMHELPLTPQQKERFLNSIDILIDGSYVPEERIYDESKKDGFHNAVGSGNQVIWDLRRYQRYELLFGIEAQLLEKITIDTKGDLFYERKRRA